MVATSVEQMFERLRAFDPFLAGEDRRELRRYLLLDVFACTPLEGNQLAVVTDGRGLDGPTMQAVARELKLSETVFVLPPEGEGDVLARIFTPTTELPFAGHPVLGTAVALAAALARTEIVLETGSGPVPVSIEPGRGRALSGRMQQPVPTWQLFAAPAELLAALGVGGSELPVEAYENGPRHVFVVLDSDSSVAALEPDLRALARVAGAAGVVCVAGAAGRYKSRMFAPGLGVAEDPATGSAAGPLAVHLARHGRVEFGQEIEIVQGVEMLRPSLLRARAQGSSERITAVEVSGEAVVLARGDLLVG
jgi:trans-2,3-dihydro-3-hydroxyanthranilate isomerase